MKKIVRLFAVLWIVLAFAGMGWAVEDFPPPRDGAGVIGNARTGASWGAGYFDVLKLNGITYALPAADGTAGQQLTTDGALTLSWSSAGANTAWDDIGNPDANDTITFGTYTATLTGAATATDQFTIQGTGNFGDVSILKVQQTTGNPTNGTVLEVISGDANVDPLVVSANGVANALIVNQDGTVDTASDLGVGGDLDVTGNFSVTGTWSVDAIAAATATQTLALDGDTTGGVTIGATSTGNVTLGDDVVVSDTYDVTIGEGVLTVDNDQAAETAVVITSDATTAGGGISVTSGVTTTNGKAIKVVADAVTTGDLLYLESSATGMTTGNFINAYNGSGTVFEVGLYGATTIAGNAATDVLTVTAGDIQITNGDIDLDNGQLAVDTTQDLANNISRNFAGAGTGPVLSVVETNAGSTNSALTVSSAGTAGTALKIDQTGTDNATGIDLNVAGDYPAIDIDASAARTGYVVDVSMTNQEAETALHVDGAWTGATDEGLIWVNTTAGVTIPAGQVLRLDQNGTGQHAAAIDGSIIYVADAATAPGAGTSYAVLIDATNIEALHVDTGESLFDELTHHTGGIDCNADFDLDTATADIGVNVESTATDGTAGFGIVTIHQNHAGNTNDVASLRIAHQADGDAQDTFILCQDASTGAAGNGTDQFKVGANGDITMGGATGTGGILAYSFENLTVESGGTAASIAVVVSFITTNSDADEDAVTLADGVQGQVKVFVSTVEGAGGDSYKITPAHMNGGTKITFDGIVGDGCTMVFDGTSWNVISNNGGSIT